MAKSPLSIIDFVCELKLLKAGSLSVAQRAVLKATYGEPLDRSRDGNLLSGHRS